MLIKFLIVFFRRKTPRNKVTCRKCGISVKKDVFFQHFRESHKLKYNSASPKLNFNCNRDADEPISTE